MKNLLFLFSLLLTVDAYCLFDTISPVNTIRAVQAVAKGTKISNETKINLVTGNYVLYFEEVPKALNKSDIVITETEGISILSIELQSELPSDKNIDFSVLYDLNEEIQKVSERIQKLNDDEKKLIDIKYNLQGQADELTDAKSFQEYYHTKGTSIRKERQQAYKDLLILREKTDGYYKKIGVLKKSLERKTKALFITVVVLDSVNKLLEWSYLLRPNRNRNAKQQNEQFATELLQDKSGASTTQKVPKFAILKGKVIEAEHGAPIIFASVEFYQKKKLIHSTSTDYNGIFKIELPTNKQFDMVINFSGYKKIKLKNIQLNRANLPLQTMSMKVKQKLSALEIIAYALPVIDMARLLAK